MTQTVLTYMESAGTKPATARDRAALAEELGRVSAIQVYPRSVVAIQHALLFLGRQGDEQYLGCLARDSHLHERFTGRVDTVIIRGEDYTLTAGERSAENAAALRGTLPHLVAQPLGLHPSAGFGDRLGLATPGHLAALREVFYDENDGHADNAYTMSPILAQQSIRENARTGRSPQEVMDDALWGAFQAGWRNGFGADADHLKNSDDIDACVAAGYSFYTIDPGEFVDDASNTADRGALHEKVKSLPWDMLESTLDELSSRLTGSVDLAGSRVEIEEEALMRAAAKYGQAVAHTVQMYRHLRSRLGDRPFDFEMSVDETETVTSLTEHVYIASELQRLGVRVTSLAPRYVGRFEKGVDYIGDLEDFRASFVQHVAVARTFGLYKLSLHSGSDKFRIYPIAKEEAGDLVHLKTAGTSYLEALRTLAHVDPGLLRDIVDLAVERYPTDRATYHVSAEIAQMPALANLADEELAALLDDFHARQILHVTFGSVFASDDLRHALIDAMRRNEQAYHDMLQLHFVKHLQPFAK